MCEQMGAIEELLAWGASEHIQKYLFLAELKFWQLLCCDAHCLGHGSLWSPLEDTSERTFKIASSQHEEIQ
jgi:hypothetical protein